MSSAFDSLIIELVTTGEWTSFFFKRNILPAELKQWTIGAVSSPPTTIPRLTGSGISVLLGLNVRLKVDGKVELVS